MKSEHMKKLLIIAFLINTISSYSQENYSIRLDILKSVFGFYQFEAEYSKNEKLSYGFGYTFIDTSLMVVGTPSKSSEANRGHSFSPFVRYYTNDYTESSPFYQANLRYSIMDWIGYTEHPKENILSLDVNYGYQFKLAEKLFLEPTIGLGAAYIVDGNNTIKGDLKPYPMLNINLSLKI